MQRNSLTLLRRLATLDILLIIKMLLIIEEPVPGKRASPERHVKTSSTVKDQTASVMGKLVRGAA